MNHFTNVADASLHGLSALPSAFFSRQTDAQLPQGEAIDVQVKFIGNPGGGFGAVETMVMTNSMPWKMAHRNRWFTY